MWMRTGPGWARIWRARTKKALWEEAAEAGETAGARQPPRWPETARRRRRPSMLEWRWSGGRRVRRKSRGRL